MTQWLLDHHYTPTHWLPDRWMPGGGESYRPDPSMLLRSQLPDNMNGNSVWRLKTDVEPSLDPPGGPEDLTPRLPQIGIAQSLSLHSTRSGPSTISGRS